MYGAKSSDCVDLCMQPPHILIRCWSPASSRRRFCGFRLSRCAGAAPRSRRPAHPPKRARAREYLPHTRAPAVPPWLPPVPLPPSPRLSPSSAPPHTHACRSSSSAPSTIHKRMTLMKLKKEEQGGQIVCGKIPLRGLGFMTTSTVLYCYVDGFHSATLSKCRA
jgi:hypothetical protein